MTLINLRPVWIFHFPCVARRTGRRTKFTWFRYFFRILGIKPNIRDVEASTRTEFTGLLSELSRISHFGTLFVTLYGPLQSGVGKETIFRILGTRLTKTTGRGGKIAVLLFAALEHLAGKLYLRGALFFVILSATSDSPRFITRPIFANAELKRAAFAISDFTDIVIKITKQSLVAIFVGCACVRFSHALILALF